MIFGWSPDSGSLSPAGWVTVLAYLAAAFLCARASNRDRKSLWLWRSLCGALLMLGIGKLVDLQSLLIGLARYFALVDHWYAERRGLQLEYIVAVLLLSLLASLALWLAVRRRNTGLKAATLGFVLLCAFVAIRASSFHGVDAWLSTRLFHLRLNHLLEWLGLAAIVTGAILAASPRGRRRPPAHLGKRRSG